MSEQEPGGNRKRGVRSAPVPRRPQGHIRPNAGRDDFYVVPLVAHDVRSAFSGNIRTTPHVVDYRVLRRSCHVPLVAHDVRSALSGIQERLLTSSTTRLTE